jgi:hypothetical protein
MRRYHIFQIKDEVLEEMSFDYSGTAAAAILEAVKEIDRLRQLAGR